MVYPLISEFKTTTGRTYGGDALYMAMAYLAGYDLANSDPTNKATIGTETSFWYDKFNLWDFNHDYILKFLTPSLEHNALIGFPSDLEGTPIINEITFNKSEQELFNKIIDGLSNTFSNIKDSAIASDAAINWDKISMVNAKLMDLDVNPEGLVNGKSIRWNAGDNAWELYTPLVVGVAGTGDITTATNLGTGFTIFKEKTSGNFNFRTITAGSNVTITPSVDGNELSIASAVGVGEANTAANVGTGEGLIFKNKTSTTINLRKLAAGPNITIATGTDDVTIEAAATNLPATMVKTDQANTYAASVMQTFRGSQFKIMNPANTFGIIIAAAAITIQNYTATIPLMTANDSFVMVSLSQILSNKELLAPIIATIVNGTGTLTLPANVTGTIPTRNTTDVFQNKTMAFDLNTFTETGAAAGGILLHNGTTGYRNQAKGSDGTFLGVSGGVVGYYTPSPGGGRLPDGTAIPNTGRWGALYGGRLVGAGWLDTTVTVSGSSSQIMKSTTEAATRVTTAATDDSIAEIKGNPIWSRQSNLKFKAKWELPQTTNTVIMVGVASVAALPTGGSHDNALNNAHGVMITCSHDIESVYQYVRNDGNATQVKVASTASSVNTTSHSVSIVMTSTDVTITLDNLTPVVYNTRLPGSTTALYPFVHIEAIGGTAKSIDAYYMQLLED